VTTGEYVGHPLDLRLRQDGADEGELASASFAVLARHVEDGAVAFRYLPGPVGGPLATGQVPVLVEDRRQLTHLFVEAKAGEADLGSGLSLATSSGEGLADEIRRGLLDETEELVGELSVAFREERLRGWGEAVPPAGPARAGPLIPVGDQAFLAERGELLTHRSDRDPDVLGELSGGGLTEAFEAREKGHPRAADGVGCDLLAGGLARGELDRL